MNKRIIIATQKHWSHKNQNSTLNTDILIIGNKLKPKIDKLFENIKPREVIVDKTISKWYTESIKSACESRNISFYSVAEQGAYHFNRFE